MKAKLTLIMIFAVLTVGIVSCGQQGGSTDAKGIVKAAINLTPSQLAVLKDPVCGMVLSNAKIGDTAVYNGGIYGFCSDDCKQKFKEDPTKYAVKK